MTITMSPRRRWFVSVVIVGLLGLQALVVALGIGSPTWPFTNYPMYSGSHQNGERIAIHRVFATLDQGQEVEITADVLGTTYYVHQLWARALVDHGRDAPPSRPKGGSSTPLHALLEAVPGIQAFRRAGLLDRVGPALIAHYEAKHDQKVVAVRVEDMAMIYRSGRAFPAETRILRTIDLRPTREARS